MWPFNTKPTEDPVQKVEAAIDLFNKYVNMLRQEFTSNYNITPWFENREEAVASKLYPLVTRKAMSDKDFIAEIVKQLNDLQLKRK